jgi:hypothetical protein
MFCLGDFFHRTKQHGQQTFKNDKLEEGGKTFF